MILISQTIPLRTLASIQVNENRATRVITIDDILTKISPFLGVGGFKLKPYIRNLTRKNETLA